jgi:hypothetical protein
VQVKQEELEEELQVRQLPWQDLHILDPSVYVNEGQEFTHLIKNYFNYLS